MIYHAATRNLEPAPVTTTTKSNLEPESEIDTPPSEDNFIPAQQPEPESPRPDMSRPRTPRPSDPMTRLGTQAGEMMRQGRDKIDSGFDRGQRAARDQADARGRLQDFEGARRQAESDLHAARRTSQRRMGDLRDAVGREDSARQSKLDAAGRYGADLGQAGRHLAEAGAAVDRLPGALDAESYARDEMARWNEEYGVKLEHSQQTQAALRDEVRNLRQGLAAEKDASQAIDDGLDQIQEGMDLIGEASRKTELGQEKISEGQILVGRAEDKAALARDYEHLASDKLRQADDLTAQADRHSREAGRQLEDSKSQLSESDDLARRGGKASRDGDFLERVSGIHQDLADDLRDLDGEFYLAGDDAGHYGDQLSQRAGVSSRRGFNLDREVDHRRAGARESYLQSEDSKAMAEGLVSRAARLRQEAEADRQEAAVLRSEAEGHRRQGQTIVELGQSTLDEATSQRTEGQSVFESGLNKVAQALDLSLAASHDQGDSVSAARAGMDIQHQTLTGRDRDLTRMTRSLNEMRAAVREQSQELSQVEGSLREMGRTVSPRLRSVEDMNAHHRRAGDAQADQRQALDGIEEADLAEADANRRFIDAREGARRSRRQGDEAGLRRRQANKEEESGHALRRAGARQMHIVADKQAEESAAIPAYTRY